VKETAPWEWMGEADIFGVQNPETDEIGFVSIMGALGEHFAVAAYLGPAGLAGFWDMHEDPAPLTMHRLVFETPQLQGSFEDRDLLRKEDREIIKELGLKFRGRNAWPLFRSFRPARHPWPLVAAEARFLTHVLEQTPDVTLRFREAPFLLAPPGVDRYLVRVPRQEEGGLVWEDRVMHVPRAEPLSIPVTIDARMLEALKGQPRLNATFEIDIFISPKGVQEDKDTRPFYPYVLMVVEDRAGMILASEFLIPEPSIESMWGTAPMNVAKQLSKLGIPQEIKVRSDLLLQVLQPFAGELQFKLTQSDILETLDPAQESMFEYFM